MNVFPLISVLLFALLFTLVPLSSRVAFTEAVVDEKDMNVKFPVKIFTIPVLEKQVSAGLLNVFF